LIRIFNPATDTKEKILELWNEHFGTDLFSLDHFSRINPENLIVVEESGEVVGFTILLDGGMPYAVLDQLYIRPRYKSFRTLRDVFIYVEALCQERGIRWFYGLLDGLGAESEKTADLLKRRAQWNLQYLGEKPMFVKKVS
jgi:hypothetical protein